MENDTPHTRLQVTNRTPKKKTSDGQSSFYSSYISDDKAKSPTEMLISNLSQKHEQLNTEIQLLKDDLNRKSADYAWTAQELEN